MTREEIMEQWDRWVKYYRGGGGASWPRDAFEALIDSLIETCPECGRQGNDRITECYFFTKNKSRPHQVEP